MTPIASSVAERVGSLLSFEAAPCAVCRTVVLAARRATALFSGTFISLPPLPTAWSA